MNNIQREFRYASGEVAEIGDIVLTQTIMPGVIDTALKMQVLDVEGGWVETFPKDRKPIFLLFDHMVVFETSAIRSGELTLMERGRLDLEDPRVAELVRARKETRPGYDPNPKNLG